MNIMDIVSLKKLLGSRFNKAVSVTLLILVIISLVGYTVARMMPLEQEDTVDLFAYQHTGTFDYTAYLNPSYLLGPEPVTDPEPPADPVYFISIVSTIDFTYSFYTSTLSHLPTKATVTAVLEHEDLWQKVIPVTEMSLGQLGSRELDIEFEFSPQYIQSVFETIDKQIKVTTNDRRVTLLVELETDDEIVFSQSLPLILTKSFIEISNERAKKDEVNSGIFNYAVNLVPNSLFDTSTLQPPPLYTPPPPPTQSTIGSQDTLFTRLVDRMDLNFSYSLETTEPLTDINSTVKIYAQVENPNIWTKNVTLLPLKPVSSDFNVSFELKLADLLQLLEDIRSETGTSAETYYLYIIAETSVTGNTKYGNINEIFTSAMKAPVSGGVLNWGETLQTIKNGAIQTAEISDNYFIADWTSLTVSAARSMFLWFSIGLLVFAAPLLFFYLKYRPPGLAAPDKQAHESLRKYKGLIIKVASLPAVREDDIIVSVNSLDDLVNIAGETGKTILYRHEHGCHYYQVLDNFTRYEYQALCA